jgi:hypothetical protein
MLQVSALLVPVCTNQEFWKEATMKRGITLAVLAVAVVCFIGIAEAAPTVITQPFSFPVTITKPGSYVLQSNLVVPTPLTTAILVKVDNVTIDMNGFAILGPNYCAGSCPASCNFYVAGTGRGIDGSAVNYLEVSNGVISGMGAEGIVANDNAVIKNVRATNNGGDGIHVINNALVDNNTSNYNGYSGIHTIADGSVNGNVADCNRTSGLYLWSNTGYSHNVAVGNGVPNCAFGVDLGGNNCP